MAPQVIAVLLAALLAGVFAGGSSPDEPKDTDEVAVLETGKGTVVLAFFPDKAPGHVANFKELVKEGFYNGTRFHRCMPGFMVQGGDPNTKDLQKEDMWGTGGKVNADGSRHNLKAEFNDTPHDRGVLSMARSSQPDSASSQFFIVVKDSHFLDHQYTAFGHVVKGMDVVDEIVKTGPTDRSLNGKVEAENAVVIKSAKITTWGEAKKG